jgi:RNA polymerase sigma factor (sigma-70 family)
LDKETSSEIETAMFRERHKYMDELVLAHLGLVNYVRHKYLNQAVYCYAEPEDYLQVGVLGLIKAIKKFDLDKGYKFSTFAAFLILGAMKDFQRECTFACRDFQTSDLQPRAPEIKYNGLFTPSKELDGAGNRVTDGDLCDFRSVDPSECAIQREFISRFHDGMNLLSKQNLRIIQEVLSGRMQKDIAEDLCVSRPRISQVVSASLRTIMAYVGDSIPEYANDIGVPRQFQVVERSNEVASGGVRAMWRT